MSVGEEVGHDDAQQRAGADLHNGVRRECEKMRPGGGVGVGLPPPSEPVTSNQGGTTTSPGVPHASHPSTHL